MCFADLGLEDADELFARSHRSDFTFTRSSKIVV